MSSGLRIVLATCLVSNFITSGCQHNPPVMERAIQPFADQASLDEYTRKAEIWSKSRPDSVGTDGFLEEIVVVAQKRAAGPEPSADSITNNQESGVDEGDIVKRIGNYIILLRRGRLFSFALPTMGNGLEARAHIDVAPAGEDMDAWYDEILAHGRTIVLLGYSEAIDATLIRKFNVAADGSLTRGNSWFYRSSDYYSANYGARLIDGRLVFYFSGYLDDDLGDFVSGRIVDGQPADVGPAFRSEIVYQPLQQTSYPELHTVAVCSLESDDIECDARRIVAPSNDLFYVSYDALYLWTTSRDWAYDYPHMSDSDVAAFAKIWKEDTEAEYDLAVVYRIPLDGTTPGAIEAVGHPDSQFSFLETPDSLKVIVDTSAWDEEDAPTLLSIPLAQFGNGISKLQPENIVVLPDIQGYIVTSRFVGSALLMGEEVETDDETVESFVIVKDLDRDLPVQRLRIEHDLSRIEPVGTGALVIGEKYPVGLGMTPIRMDDFATVGQAHVLPNAVPAEWRSHGFNYRQDESMDIVGLAVTYVPDIDDRYSDWKDNPIDVHMTYLALMPDLSVQTLGSLVGRSSDEDNCEVSCEDWYGHARPFFVDDQIYALIGYQLIEGYLSGMSIHESARANALSLLH